MSDAEGLAPAAEVPAGVTPGAQDLAPEQAEQTDPVTVALCPICGHAQSAHVDSGRCLIMLGEYGTEGPCPCPEPLPGAVQIGGGG